MFLKRSDTRVAFFGLNVEESYEFYDIQDAFNFLVKRVRHSHEEDILGYDLDNALNFLQSISSKKYAFDNFRRALTIGNPTQRVMGLRDALKSIRNQLENKHMGDE